MTAKEKVKIILTDLKSALLKSNGDEINNPKPMVVPDNCQRPPTLQEQIKRLMRNEMSQMAHDNGQETYEEANDFAIEEEFDQDELVTPYVLMEEEHSLPKDQNVDEILPEENAPPDPDPDQPTEPEKDAP